MRKFPVCTQYPISSKNHFLPQQKFPWVTDEIRCLYFVADYCNSMNRPLSGYTYDQSYTLPWLWQKSWILFLGLRAYWPSGCWDQYPRWLKKKCHLTSISNPIVEIRRSYDRLISTMGIPILVRWHLYIESCPMCPFFKSSRCNTFEDWAPVDQSTGA